MRKAVLAICAILAVAGVLYAGYHVAASAEPPRQGEPVDVWPTASVRLAVAISDYPLFYEQGEGYSGFFADLLQQAPLQDRQWVATPLNRDDALAAVAARSVDLALAPRTRGDASADGLAFSPPLLSASVSLFSADAMIPMGGYGDKDVAWYGPDGVAQLVVRLGATPVSMLSPTDCIRAAASRQATACAIDENLGQAAVALLGLDNLYITGESLGVVEYTFVWAESEAQVGAAVRSWLTNVDDNGVLAVLRRKWLGERVARAVSGGVPTTIAVGLALACGLSMSVSLALAARYRGLRRLMRSRQTEWRDSQARYRTLLESTTDAVFVLGSDQTTIVQANGRAEEITGYAGAELLKTRFDQLVPARQRRLMREWFVDGSDGSRAEEVPLVRKDGSVATVEMRIRNLDIAGAAVRLCLVRDTTEQKSLLREVRRVRDVADRIFEHTTNGVVTVDSDCRVVSCNGPLLQALGRDGDTVGQPIDSVLHTEGPAVIDLVHSALAEGNTQRSHVSLLDSGGRPVPSAVVVSPLRDEQAISGAVLVFTTISEESKAREESQRLGVLSALGQVSGVLAHDIRNRVAGVNVGVQYLAEKYPPEDPRRQSMEYIRTETEKVVQIIDDILMLIRPGRVDKTLCRVSDIVQGVVRSQAAYAFGREVTVTAIVSQEPMLVHADFVQLERALANLVKNGIEAAPQGGSVQVAADRIVRGLGGRDGDGRPRSDAITVRIRVSDDGPGIPAGVRARLFQLFASEKNGGTGLGLYITKRIIDDHGGSIEVEPREGRGTTFTVLLPGVNERET